MYLIFTLSEFVRISNYLLKYSKDASPATCLPDPGLDIYHIYYEIAMKGRIIVICFSLYSYFFSKESLGLP